MSNLKKFTLCLVCLVFLLLTFTACSTKVTWLDADGTLLYEEAIKKDESIPQKELPPDSNEWHYIQWNQLDTGKKEITFLADREQKTHVVWLDGEGNVLYDEYVIEPDASSKELPKDTRDWHYTGWKQTAFGNESTFVADRVANQVICWKDADGTSLAEEWIPVGQIIPDKELPKDTSAWHYTGWAESKKGNEYTYTAERELKKEYFVGNVFQIVAKDLAGTPIATGTGFVFNKAGWFITNAHVMKDAYQAAAVFEIKNSATGESFTTLEIKEGSYVHHDKDIFIGKIDNYSKIANNYSYINFETEHSVGDITYSVGYPNSSVSMEIHKGKIEKDLSSLYDKLYSGNAYIASSSYIAPGSSGGILVNDKAEVIGMTTLGWFDDNGNFKLGAAIEAFNYTNLTNNLNYSDLQDIAFLLHPNDKTFIKFFRSFITWHNVKKDVDKNGDVYYQCKWEVEGVNDTNVDYVYEESLTVYSNGNIAHSLNHYWANGDHRETQFYGVYSSENEFDSFKFSFKYTWGNNTWYSLVSDDINYAENVNLTLHNYTKASSYNYTISDDLIKYAKECFNSIYEGLYVKLEIHK